MKPGDPLPTERPQTVKNVGEDGRTHVWKWNPETRTYDIDLGPAYGVEPMVIEEEPA